ncbi:F0F1 ATP synthase subunit B [Mediterraneibacter sp. NSJ-55]|uniref:ATP synthase subunit b n=1 Tax=Mediterraneibacter hominis TaxID=2763054 RepID=A0A923LIY1_9FIRM|nr:F0F1 ATP synthase subunit B [Mediterraneibacter hominis]
MLQLNMNLLYTIINLVVLYLLLRHFLIKPVTEIMEKRKKLIEDGLLNAQNAQDDAAKMKREYEAALSGAKQESAKILEKAQRQAKEEYEKILQKADEKAADMMESAKESIRVQREQTIHELQSQIAGLALNAAAKIVGEKTENQGNQEIYNQFLEEVGEAFDDPDKK